MSSFATNLHEVSDGSFTEREQMDYKLRRKVRSKQDKLRAAKMELDIEKQEFSKALDRYTAAVDQPNATEQELDELWKPCEMKRRHVQAYKMFLHMCQEKADKADAALSSFETETIETEMRRKQASTYSISFSFSINPDVHLGRPTELPSHPYCTCASAIMDCDVCFSHRDIYSTTEQMSTASSTPEQSHASSEETGSATDQTSAPSEETCSPKEHSPPPAQNTCSTIEPVHIQLNKYGDIPNPARQIKAARRRRNQELRRTDPERYRHEIAEKKLIRDAKLRAERELRRRR